MFRFFETCSAAMNCPWFLKPVDASSSVTPLGSSAVTFAASCGCEAIFAAIGDVVVVFVVGAVVVVGVVVVVVVGAVVVVGFAGALAVVGFAGCTGWPC